MAQFYTLDEAAQRLGLSVEDFKRRSKTEFTSLRPFRDGATLRYRASDIDELARTLGVASDPGLPLGEAKSPLNDSSEEYSLNPKPASKPSSKPPSSRKLKPPSEQPLFMADDSDDIFALPAEAGGSKSKPKKGDSDVRLDQTPSRSDPRGKEPTEEISLDLNDPPSAPRSGSKLLGPKSSGRLKPGGASKIPGPGQTNPDDGSSEFELSLDADSDSFELQLNSDSSEEDALGGGPAGGAGQSGVNLGKPADSGVNLEKKKKAKNLNDSDSDVDFELALDPASKPGPKSKPVPRVSNEEASSEFELTLDDSSGSESMNNLASQVQAEGDIFETDFELPSISDDDSGSEVMPVESSDTDLENSDFDLAISDTDAPGDDDSASQVVLMDDDVVLEDGEIDLSDPGFDPLPKTKGRGKANRFADTEDGSDIGMAAVAARENRRGQDDDDEPIRAAAAPPPRWGILPALVLAPTFLVVLLGGLMAFELVRGTAGYQQPSASPLVRGMAGALNLKTGD